MQKFSETEIKVNIMTINNQTNSPASGVKIDRLNNDVNGNPRYVAHFLDFNTNEERASNVLTTGEKYSIAIIRAKTVGARKYHNKQFGGGISWSNYGCNQEFINYSFEAFAKSKDYYQADTMVALTVINSQDIANQIKTLVEQWCINGRGWNTHPIAIVSQAVQDYAP